MKQDRPLKIAIVGCGEVGLSYARAFSELGQHELSLCEAVPSPALKDFAVSEKQTIHSAPGAWLSECDIIMSIVTGSASLAVCRDILQFAAPGNVYADFTTARPDDKRSGARACEEKGVSYVDVAIMGAIALSGAKTPLLITGKDWEKVKALMQTLKTPTAVIEDGNPGDAISLKLMRSIFTKGLEALAVECLVAAEAFGVRERLYSVLSDIDNTSLRDFLEMLVRTHVLHAGRRRQEVVTATRQLRETGLATAVLPGVEALFARTTRDLGNTPLGIAQPTAQQAIEWLKKSMSDAHAAESGTV